MAGASASASPTSGDTTTASCTTSGSNYYLLSVAELTELCLALGALRTNGASSGKPELVAALEARLASWRYGGAGSLSLSRSASRSSSAFVPTHSERRASLARDDDGGRDWQRDSRYAGRSSPRRHRTAASQRSRQRSRPPLSADSLEAMEER
jgi:hypothetical protein